MILEFTKTELIDEPLERQLNMSRSIVVFNIKKSDKTNNLNTGQQFNYEQEIYEIMNREQVESVKDYVKFNCVLKKTVE